MKNVGVYIAVSIILSWAASLIFWLTQELGRLSPLWVGFGMLLQTFLYTGLFITAHDGMHGSISKASPRLNNAIGKVSVWLYALFSFQRLKSEHRKHHVHAGHEDDPDYHDGEHTAFFSWYARFMRNYMTWKQLVGMAVVFNALHYGLNISQTNLILFWVVPALLSTLQLFYFGTYLPHKEPEGGYHNRHRAVSNEFSVFWSFMTCYHFGYHLEHHARPKVPWWRLPALRREIEKRGHTFNKTVE